LWRDADSPPADDVLRRTFHRDIQRQRRRRNACAAFVARRECRWSGDGIALSHARSTARRKILLLLGRDPGPGAGVAGGNRETARRISSQKIWQPMGAEADASWTVDKGGYE